MASNDLLHLLHAAEEDRKKEKSPSALRTISEAADMLDVPQHVLRFWETKFAQIKPLKRNGGRRFYRPEDIAVLQQIKHLLYKQGYTIKGAKKAIEEFAKIVDATLRADDNTSWLHQIPPANSNDNVAPESPVTELALDITTEPSSTVTHVMPTDRQQLQALRNELAAMKEQLAKLVTQAA
ncbi:MAG: MerR family transcriptional regulator [Alphaproteobacteria bacterium]|nr:MerR family transcriptional regulator [Alphaproteobacteria bacterium]